MKPSQETGVLPFDRQFVRYNDENRAGLAVLAVKNGKTVFQKGYGLRNLKTEEKVDCDTNFRMASVSKQFTAMGVAVLEQMQKISTGDSIGQYLPELPAYMKDITVGHLIHHLSGLPDYSDALWSSDTSKPMISNHDVYDYYKKKKKLNFKPGKKHDYSNGGYSLLALVVENAANESFPEFMDRYVFKPANMPNSAIITYPSNIKNQATSYSNWPFFEDIDYNTGNALHGEDGVFTSVADMQGWANAIESNALVSPAMTKKIFSAAKTNSGKKVKYGYGWCIDRYKKEKLFTHGGSWLGFNTTIMYLPTRRLWLVGFSNTQAIDSFEAVEQMLEYYWDVA